LLLIDLGNELCIFQSIPLVFYTVFFKTITVVEEKNGDHESCDWVLGDLALASWMLKQVTNSECSRIQGETES
jgi:hypothetical protein